MQAVFFTERRFTSMHKVIFEPLVLLSVAGLPVSDYSVRSSSGLSEEAHRG